MFRNVTAEKAIAFTQLVVALSYCWPLAPSVTKYQVLRFKIARTIAVLNSIVLCFPLFYSIRVYRHNAENLSKMACFLFAMIQIAFQTTFYTIKYKRLQRLIKEMIIYCEGAKPYERQVFQKYVNKFSTFYGMSAIWFYRIATFMCPGTVFISDPFPTNAMYPFYVNLQPVKTIIFVHQAFAGLQVAAHACISVFGALLLLFARARFEILAMELRSVNNIDSLIKCIRKYHALKRYANEIANSFRFVAVYIVIVSGVGAEVCGINIIGFISSVFSLFTALRVLLLKDENES